MTVFQVQYTDETVQMTFDRKHFNEDELLKILSFLRHEFLAKKIDFSEDMESLGNEIKKDWWVKNKNRFIKD
jgi:hypothetical protein